MHLTASNLTNVHMLKILYQTKQKCMKQAKICRIMVVKKGAFGGGLFIIGWNKHRNAFAAIFINIFRMHLYVDEFLLAPISMVKIYKLGYSLIIERLRCLLSAIFILDRCLIYSKNSWDLLITQTQ